MAVFQCEFHFWTFANRYTFPDKITGLCRYVGKNDNHNDGLYKTEKINFLERRDVLCRPSSKRPEKLKYSLKVLENLLATKTILKIFWYSRKLLQIFTSDLMCITCLVCPYTCDVERIFIDETLIGKLSSAFASDLIAARQYLIVTHPDKKSVDYIYFSRPRFDDKKLQKLTSLDPTIFSLEIPSWSNVNVKRNLSASPHNDLVLAWSSNDIAFANFEQNIPNMVLLIAGNQKLEVVTSIKTPGNLQSATFSKSHSDIVLCLEQNVNINVNSSCTVSRYNFSRNQFYLISSYTLSLKEKMVCSDWSNEEEKLILCDAIGSLILYHSAINLVKQAKAVIKPAKVQWHSSGSIFYVCSSQLEIQIFDMALTSLKLVLKSDWPNPELSINISSICSQPIEIIESVWAPPIRTQEEDKFLECNDIIAFAFKTGSLVLLSTTFGVVDALELSPLHLIRENLRHDYHSEAVSILKGQNWNANTDECFASLSEIFNKLIKMTFTLDIEDLLQQTLATYYAPSFALNEFVVLQFKENMKKMARRFFFYLFRNNRLEKAFLIATDIMSHDLFMDLHYRALDLNECAFADICFKKGQEIQPKETLNNGEDLYRSISPQSITYDDFDDSDDDYDGLEDHDDYEDIVDDSNYWSTLHPTMQALEHSLRTSLKNAFTKHL